MEAVDRSGHANVADVPIYIDPVVLESALWDRLADFTIKSMKSYKQGAEHFALDGTIQHFKQNQKIKDKLRERIAARLGHDPFAGRSGGRSTILEREEQTVLAALEGHGGGAPLSQVILLSDLQPARVPLALRRLQDKGLAYAHDNHGSLAVWGGISGQAARYWSTRKQLHRRHGYGDAEMPRKR